ncbi:Caspase-6 [Xenoophorus captivus]|uniref:Caspase-6 n=1 Tax=Xenoophorus captivus TaxID=1517983 RepID=A0ABV0REF8_9TELE
MPRPGYRHPPPNGCGSPLFGFQFDLGIPSMTKCCNQHDRCYDTCGREKHDCDEQFQDCLETICRNVQRTLGLAQSVQEADCFLLAFLSHGENDHVYTYDGKISIQDITSMFKGDRCQTLVGKPKIFVVQVGRRNKHDVPVTPCDVVDNELKTNETVVDSCAIQTLPAGADFIMCYSVAEGFCKTLNLTCSTNFTPLGYYSHRETINGSWYIQDLCELLQKYGSSLEFTELLTLVNRKVSMRRVGNSNDRSAIGKKQVPCFASMLTKKLYFRPKK